MIEYDYKIVYKKDSIILTLKTKNSRNFEPVLVMPITEEKEFNKIFRKLLTEL